MSVKRVRSAERMLSVIDALAAHQPIGVGALATLIDDDKSAVQRMLMTLADAGWIQPTGTPTKWELSTHVLTLAEQTRGRHTLARSVRPTMEALRDETSETIILAAREGGGIVIVDVCQSTQMVRAAPNVGIVIPVANTATGHAILLASSDAERAAILGGPPNASLLAELQTAKENGYTMTLLWAGSSSVGAPIIDSTGAVLGALALAAPSARMPAERLHYYGRLLAERCRALSL